MPLDTSVTENCSLMQTFTHLQTHYNSKDSLNVVNVLSLFHPLICQVGGVGVSLTLQKCILGHVESGVLRGDEDDWRPL